MNVTKPPHLEEGDTVAVLSPSSGAASLFPHILDNGEATLRRMGFDVKEYETTRADPDYLYNHPERRAEDVNKAFRDPGVDAIFSTVGGEDSVRILPYIDEDAVMDNPKPVMGFSDFSTLLTYCCQRGLATLHGPAVMAGFSQMEQYPRFEEHVHSFLTEPVKHEYEPYPEWSEGYPEWGEEENTGLVNERHPNERGWEWIQGEERVEGTLYGGSLDVLQFMVGTDYWPDREFWDGKILLLETSENEPSPRHVRYVLRNYGMMGALDRISGLMFGRARGYTDEEKNELNENIQRVVRDEFDRGEIPIVTNMDFGHTDPQLVLPLGTRAELDPADSGFRLTEKALK